MKEKSKLVLIINTTKREEIMIGLYDDQIKKEVYKTDRQSEDILILLDKFIKKAGRTLNDLTAILVNIDQGSYTGVRIGVTIANTLAWSLDIPVFGYQEKDFELVLKKAQNASDKFSKIALPIYADSI